MSSKEKTTEEAINELTKNLNEFKDSHKNYVRILAVKMVKMGETRTKVADYVHVDRQTVGRWVKKYDKEGIDGLIPDYSNCGRKCLLTDDQLAEIYDTVTNPNAFYSIKDMNKLIENEYEVKYSYKQAWTIARVKLNLNYRKPFIKYGEAPKDAKEQFKKNYRNRLGI